MSDGRTRSLIVRFPDGTKEFRYPDKRLGEGDTIWHAGKPFRVISVGSDHGSGDFVTVEPASGLGDLLRSEEGAIHLDEILGGD